MKFLLENYNFHLYDTIFKHLNIDFNKIRKIGEGDNGIAYYCDNKIYKITTDPKETELAYILVDERLKNYVKIYDIFCYDIGYGTDNIINHTPYAIKCSYTPRYYWIIVQEFLEEITFSKYYKDALLYFVQYIDNKFDYSKEAFDQMIESYKKSLEFNFNSEETIHYLTLFRNLFIELHKYGIIAVQDLKIENLGKKDGYLKFFDLRFIKGVNKDIKNIKQLN